MNCRQMTKIMPELAAGELDHTTEQKALLHIKECPHCAAELAKYQEVLNAMSEPWETLEAPADLYLPIYSHRQRPVIKRLCLAAAAAMVLAIIIILPKHHRLPDHETQTVTNVKPDNTIVTAPKDTAAEDEIMTSEEQPVLEKSEERRVIVKIPKRVRYKTIRHRSNVLQEREQQAIKETVDTATAEAVGPQPAPVIVVASQSPRPPVIKIESVDHATGEVCITQVVYNHSGDNLESEVRYTPNNPHNWREEL